MRARKHTPELPKNLLCEKKEDCCSEEPLIIHYDVGGMTQTITVSRFMASEFYRQWRKEHGGLSFVVANRLGKILASADRLEGSLTENNCLYLNTMTGEISVPSKQK